MNSSERELIEQELLELDRKFLDAILHHDVSYVDRTLPDDFLSIFPNGRVANKADELENVRTVGRLFSSVCPDYQPVGRLCQCWNPSFRQNKLFDVMP